MFGRGGEELEVLAEEGIPLLRGARHHRRRRCHRLCGHSAHPPRPCPERRLHHRPLPEGGQADWQQLAATSQTLVIYMGLMRSGISSSNW